MPNYEELETLYIDQGIELQMSKQLIKKQSNQIIAHEANADYWKQECEKLKKDKPVSNTFLIWLFGAACGALILGSVLHYLNTHP